MSSNYIYKRASIRKRANDKLRSFSNHCTGSVSGARRVEPRACLDPKYFPKFYYAKRRFPITSKCRHIYEVLNVDEIKN
jgi:hypothetical protein